MRTSSIIALILVIFGCTLAPAPAEAAGDPSGFAYALVDRLTGNQLYGYRVDPGGVLTALPGFPIATGGAGTPGGATQVETVAYDSVQKRVYVLNVFSKTVNVFSVDPATGALSSLSFSPIVLPASVGRDICINLSPDGSILVVCNSAGLVYSYKIGASSVTAAPGSPFAAGGAVTPFSTAFSRDGAYLYAGGAGVNLPQVAGFSVTGATGALASLPGSPFDVGSSFELGFQTDASGRIFAANNAGVALAFVFSTAAGIPSEIIPPDPVTTLQAEIQSGVLHPSGYYLTTARSSNNIGVFRIGGSGNTTTMAPVAGSPFATGGAGSNISVFDTSGTLVTTAHGDSLNLGTFQFNTTTGALASLSLQPANTLGATGSIVGLSFVPFAAAPAPPPPGSPTPTPTPTAFPPSISPIPEQMVLQNKSVTVPFTITGAVLTYALRTSVSTSNATLLPVAPSTLATSCTPAGDCTLLIAPEDGRAGSAVVTVSVTDGYYTTTRSINVTVPGVRPSAPAVALANVVGSGIVLTWSATDTGTPMGYAIGWGTDPAASNLPTQLVPGDTTRFEFSALPNGTYYFRVFGVGTGDLGTGSAPTSATVATGATVPGPPLGLGVNWTTAGFNANWTPPTFGASPTLYEVQIGSRFGLGDLGGGTTDTASFSKSIGAGNYWVRARAAAGGSTGAWSSSVQIALNPPSCTSAPGVPILLPVTTTSGRVTFTWVPLGAAADSYQVQVSPGAGLAPVATFASAGAGTSLVWAQTSGSFAARVVATNACGTSASSNEFAFTIQP